MAGMLTLLIGMRGEIYEKITKAMKAIRDHLHLSLDVIKEKASDELFGHAKPNSKDHSEEKLFTKIEEALYQMAFWTIGDSCVNTTAF